MGQEIQNDILDGGATGRCHGKQIWQNELNHTKSS